MDFLMELQISITLFLQNLGSWLTSPFVGLSFLATEPFFIVLMPLIFWSIDSLLGVRMAFMLVISGTFNSILKMLFHTPRPFWFDSRVQSLSQETSFGIPSGHSQNSISLFGIMAVTVRKKAFTIFLVVIIFLIGLSRIYLGMHFIHDVLTGWLFGILFLIIYLRLEMPAAKWITSKTLSMQILLSFLFSMVLILLSLATQSTSLSWQMPEEWVATAAITGGAIPNPFNIEGQITLAAVAFGFMSGLACWVKRFGLPKVKGSWLKRLLRYFVGIIGVFAIYLGLKVILPEEPLMLGLILRFLRYTLLGFWVSFLAPIVFKQLKLEN